MFDLPFQTLNDNKKRQDLGFQQLYTIMQAAPDVFKDETTTR